jgi:glycerophosphoryl diester phosphodiesterase
MGKLSDELIILLSSYFKEQKELNEIFLNIRSEPFEPKYDTFGLIDIEDLEKKHDAMNDVTIEDRFERISLIAESIYEVITKLKAIDIDVRIYFEGKFQRLNVAERIEGHDIRIKLNGTLAKVNF